MTYTTDEPSTDDTYYLDGITEGNQFMNAEVKISVCGFETVSKTNSNTTYWIPTMVGEVPEDYY